MSQALIPLSAKQRRDVETLHLIRIYGLNLTIYYGDMYYRFSFSVRAHCKSGTMNAPSGPENCRHSSGTVQILTCQVYPNICLCYFKERGDQIRTVHTHTLLHHAASSIDAWQLLLLVVGVPVSVFSTISYKP